MSELKSRTKRLSAGTVRPAAEIWNEPMPDSLEDQLCFFDKNGFLVLRGLLSTGEVAELSEELGRLAHDHKNLPAIREGFDLEPIQSQSLDVPSFRKIGGITDLSDAFGRLRNNPRILELLHAILGKTVRLWRDICMMKPARVGREKPWHQDSVYWPWMPMTLVSVMTALDDTTASNGALQVIPGTHRQVRQHYGDELMVDISEQEWKGTRCVPLAAGDSLLFHSMLLHASEPNLSDRNRRVCIVSYLPDDSHYVGQGDQPDCPLVSRR